MSWFAWMDPKGRIHNIPRGMTHNEWMRRHEGASGDMALDEGWVRLGVGGATGRSDAIETNKEKVVDWLGDPDQLMLDIWDFNNLPVETTRDELFETPVFGLAVRAERREKMSSSVMFHRRPGVLVQMHRRRV